MKRDFGWQRLAVRAMALAVVGSAPVLADGGDLGPYVGGGLGIGRPVAVGDNKLGVVPAFSAGYTLSNGLRPELELSYRSNSKNGGSVHAASGMANLWYDLWEGGYYFYAGGGVGESRVHIGGGGVSASDTSPAWQLGFGFGNALTRHLTLGLDFRHLASLNTLKFNVAGTSVETSHYMSNAAMLELRYSFGGRLADPVFASESLVRVVSVAR